MKFNLLLTYNRVQEIETELTHVKEELQLSRAILIEAEQEKNSALQSLVDVQSKSVFFF